MLVERHMKDAYNVAYGFVNDHDTAQDIVQEAFIRVHGALGRFRGEARFSTWVYRIVVNVSLNRVRQDRLRSERELRSVALASTAPAPEADGTEDVRAHLERALHELPTLQRAVLILRHLEGLSTRQVSEILHCSEGSVKTHLFRAIRGMRKKLDYMNDHDR